MDPSLVLAATQEHARAEAMLDMDRTLAEWANEDTAIQEYRVDIAAPAGAERYRVISMTPVRSDGLLLGERLYCDEGFVRALLGELFDPCEPVVNDPRVSG